VSSCLRSYPKIRNIQLRTDFQSAGNVNHHPRIHPFGSNRGKGRVGNKAGTSRWGILGQINRSRRRPDPFLVLVRGRRETGSEPRA